MVADPTVDSSFRDALLARIGGDAALAAAMAALFLEEYPRLLDNVHRAVAAQDAAVLSETAHALKGSVSNFPWPAATAAAARLEMIGGSGDCARSGEALPALDAELALLVAVLKEMIA